jgi:hypothetical protein
MVSQIVISNNTVKNLIPDNYYITANQYIDFCNKMPNVYSSPIVQDNTKKLAELLYYTKNKMLQTDINYLKIFDVNFELRKCELNFI